MTCLDPQITEQLAAELPAEVLQEVLETYRLDLGRLREALHEAARRGDDAAFCRAAHALAGAAGGIGATEIGRLARQSMAAQAGAVAAYPELDAALIRTCEAIDALARRIAGRRPSQASTP